MNDLKMLIKHGAKKIFEDDINEETELDLEKILKES